MYYLSQRSLANIAGVHPDLQRIAKRAIEITLVDFGYGNTAGRRTAEQQAELWRAGLSKCDGTIRKSKHQDGLALDFYAYMDRKGSWQSQHLAMVAAAHLQAASELGIAIHWGGLWKSRGHDTIYGWDMAHIELVNR